MRQRVAGVGLTVQEQGSRWLTTHGAGVWRRTRRLHRFAPARVVMRHADCREVLERNDVFRVPYLENMERVFAPFILGWDAGDGSRYELERDWLLGAVHRSDGDRLAERARALSEHRIAQARANGGLDVVADLADPVIDDAIGAWFGVRAAQRSARLDHARAAFYGVFLNAFKVPVAFARARAAATALADEIAAAAARHEAGDGDVLARLLAARDAQRALDDAAVVRNLVGLVTAWVPQVARVLPLALDALFDRERELGEACDAARAGDVARVGDYLWEAARFRCTNPLLPRDCAAEHTLAGGKTIPADTRVFAMLQAAMMDSEVFDDPGRFVAGRPADAYLHFGGGLHRCFGEGAARAQLGAAATALLACDGLRRAGRVRWRGPFPAALRVELR